MREDIAVNFTDSMFRGMYNGKQYHVADIATVLSRAWSAGVDRIIRDFSAQLVCTQQDEFDDSGDPEKHFEALLSLAKEGVEKGKYFEKQFELAYATKLPMFLHMRAAAEDFCDILEQNKHRFCSGVAHSFTGSAKDRDRLLSFSNLYIGVNGCSLKTSENLDVVKGIPLERMMIETDSPYCEIKNTHTGINFVKSTWPSKKKEKQVLEVVAGCKGIADVDQLSKTLYHNTCSMLTKLIGSSQRIAFLYRVFFPQDLDSAADALLAGGQSAS
ncbi:putative deoxyribonuclease TATDN1 [Sesamum angolense]|uniref:Deoxyribonuclease TATDN1 n=1 Tax=Sesamum angolense TaxID=2727404 RepID=A0AAE1WNW3_9LAMI|nr:putative deoxyribonuclease TATDN1 [Sesamum angolense]